MVEPSVSVEQLDVEELKITSAVLIGSAHHYGRYCGQENDDFMGCRIDNKDPRKCIEEGKRVTKCAMDFFQKIKGSCHQEFTEHWTCLDYRNQDYRHCRKTQKVYDACMLEKLNIERKEQY